MVPAGFVLIAVTMMAANSFREVFLSTCIIMLPNIRFARFICKHIIAVATQYAPVFCYVCYNMGELWL